MKITSGMSPFDQLKAMYTLFENQVPHFAGSTLVCKEKCASCCTCNVTLTHLEARFLVDHLSVNEKQELLRKIQPALNRKRYLPMMTFNRFARFCMEGIEPPEEENDPNWGQCSFLENQLCTIYQSRPFGCRALLSTCECKENGYASLSESILTLNNLFLQYIEHLDQDGFTGNLLDMLAHVLTNEPEAVESGSSTPVPTGSTQKNKFVQNEPVRILMVPPELQNVMRPVIERLNAILAAGTGKG